MFPEKPPRSLPRAARSKCGEPYTLRWVDAALGPRLIEMYLAFQPRNSFQGLPPLRDEVCVRWVQSILTDAASFAAVADDGALIGHTALFPVNAQKCELLAVVAPAWQNRGIGTELVHGAVQLADELGFQRIWLPVDAINVRARHVYQKCGFEYVSQGHARELDMALDVRRVVARGRLDRAAPFVPAPLGPFGTSRAERQSGASCDT